MRLLAFAFIAFLLLGCTSQPSHNAGTGEPAAPSGDAAENLSQTGEAGHAQNNGSGGAAPIQPNDTATAEQPPESTGNDYSGKDFAQLASLGVPLECDINSTYQGKPASYKVYMNGTSMLRVESATGLSQCSRTISVARSGRIYFACEGKMVFPSCDWLREDYSVAGKSSTFDFTSLQPSQIACRDWTYNKATFTTSGEICHMGG